jgi:hypothetical protein
MRCHGSCRQNGVSRKSPDFNLQISFDAIYDTDVVLNLTHPYFPVARRVLELKEIPNLRVLLHEMFAFAPGVT